MKPKDIFAIVLLIGVFTLKFLGQNGSFDEILIFIVGYYFGHRKSGVDNGKSSL